MASSPYFGLSSLSDDGVRRISWYVFGKYFLAKVRSGPSWVCSHLHWGLSMVVTRPTMSNLLSCISVSKKGILMGALEKNTIRYETGS